MITTQIQAKPGGDQSEENIKSAQITLTFK